MDRRSFMQKSGYAMLSAVVAPHVDMGWAAGKKKYKMGLQLFTIRDAMAEDPVSSLKKVAALGYQDLETYGLEPEQGKYYGFKAADFKKVLEDHNLTTSTGHYDLFGYMDKPASHLERYVDQCIAGAKAINQSYITWPWMAPEARTHETFKRLPEVLNKIGEQVTKSGLGFAYHNHGFEFVDYGGETGYDIIMRETDPALVKLQLDMYWAAHSSKLSSVELIARQPDRFVMWHIKDMDKVTRDYTELGNGSIDYHAVLSEASQEGLEFYFLEQGGNFAHNSMQSITDSAAYFKKNLKKYL